MQSFGSRTTHVLVALAVVAGACTSRQRTEPVPVTPTVPAATSEPAETTDAVVSSQPCPEPVNSGNGCIHLGMVIDGSSSPEGDRARRVAQAQVVFWDAVNSDGGIAGHDVDVQTFAGTVANASEAARAYGELRDRVVALAHVSGPGTVAALVEDLRADRMVAVPSVSISDWLFVDEVAETGSSACVEAMNAVDYAVERIGGFRSVVVVHADDLTGRDTAAGARIAAEAHDLPVRTVQGRPGGATGDVVASERPVLAIVATAPDRAASVVQQVRGLDPRATVVLSDRAWDPLALDDPADVPAAHDLLLARPVREYGMASVGHGRMRAALADTTPDEASAFGWVLGQPLHAALSATVDGGDVTRAGVLTALTALDEVDYDGMLPELTGTFGADTPAGQAALRTVFSEPAPDTPTGIRVVDDYYNSTTAGTYPFSEPCGGPTPTG